MGVAVVQHNRDAPNFLELVVFMTNIGSVVHDIVDLTHCPDQTLPQIDILFVRKRSRFIRRGVLF